MGPIQEFLKNIPYIIITLLNRGLHCSESILYTMLFEIDQSKIIVIYKKICRPTYECKITVLKSYTVIILTSECQFNLIMINL